MPRLQEVFNLLLLARRNCPGWVGVPSGFDKTTSLHDGWVPRHILALDKYGGTDVSKLLRTLELRGIVLEKALRVPKGDKKARIHYRMKELPAGDKLKDFNLQDAG